MRHRAWSERRVAQDLIYEGAINDDPTSTIWPEAIGKGVGGIRVIDEKEGIRGSSDGVGGVIGGVL